MTVLDQICLMQEHVRQHREKGKHGKANKLAEQMLRTLSNYLTRNSSNHGL